MKAAQPAAKHQTGLPEKLKEGVEALSGLDLAEVRVHTGSDMPTQLRESAYAQGDNIHLAPGQERHLPHEAWHVIQQAPGRVKPRVQIAAESINDDSGLEREAAAMGTKAAGTLPDTTKPDAIAEIATYPKSERAVESAANDNPGRTNFVTLVVIAAASCWFSMAAPIGYAQASPATQPAPTTQMTTQHAKGTFEVTLQPLPLAGAEAGEKLARMSIDKRFEGDLVGTSKGEMLSAMGDVKGSAGYVAIEKVVGTLGGHQGSFVLQHSGTMDRGVPQLIVSVVPDTGTGGLAGIAGTLQIDIKDGKHFYDFAYSLPR